MTIEALLSTIIKKIKTLPIGDYSTPLAFSKIIRDTTIRDSVVALAEKLNAQTITDLLLVGIGGSHFGVQAVYDALYGNDYRQPPVRFHALTTIDSWSLGDFSHWLSSTIRDPQRRLFVFVVSKSGTTFETVSQASLCFDILKDHAPETYRNNLCVITDEDSLLWQNCLKQNIEVLTLPKLIGGRYSVFSAAGLALLYFLKIDINALLQGAQSVECHEPLASSDKLFSAYNQGFLVHDTFIFMPHYAALGGWVRQLIGESLGKAGKGFLPTVSLGSQDLHSVAQYYFAGPLKIVTTFLLPAQSPHAHTVVPDTLFCHVGGMRAGLPFIQIESAIIQGVLAAYRLAEKPFFVFECAKGSAYDIGRFMQYKMLETVYIAELLGINPFDQPEVELYKKETRRLLA